MDKKDERVFAQEVKAQQFAAGDRVIRNKTKDRALYFVLEGTFFTLDENYPNMGPIYRDGAVIGIDQFLKDDYWPFDLICQEAGIICKYEYDSFATIKYSNAQTSSKIYNRIVRHKVYSLLYEKKNNTEYYTDRLAEQMTGMDLKDEDFFIDLKLGSEKDI
jgi:hypothetical protein